MSEILSYLVYINSGLTVLLLLTIGFKIYSLKQINKKEVIALFLDKNGIPHGERKVKAGDLTVSDEKNKHTYNVEGFSPQIRFGKKYFLVYRIGDPSPIDVLGKYKMTSKMTSETLNKVMKNSVLQELLKVKSGLGFLENLSPKQMALIGGGVLVAIMFFLGVF